MWAANAILDINEKVRSWYCDTKPTEVEPDAHRSCPIGLVGHIQPSLSRLCEKILLDPPHNQVLAEVPHISINDLSTIGFHMLIRWHFLYRTRAIKVPKIKGRELCHMKTVVVNWYLFGGWVIPWVQPWPFAVGVMIYASKQLESLGNTVLGAAAKWVLNLRLLHSPCLMALRLTMGYDTWPPIGWHCPFVIGWFKYWLDYLVSQCIVGSRIRRGFLPFFKGDWQSHCAALTAGKCLLLGLYEETVKASMLNSHRTTEHPLLI